MIRYLIGTLLVIGAVGCTEKLTTPGGCPALCPGGEPVVRDTVIDALVGLDSSFVGYSSLIDGTSLLLSNGGPLGEARGVVRFFPRGDSVTVGDTTYALVPDSVVIRLGLQDREVTSTGLALELYRLDRTVDSSVTWAELTAQMVPSRLLQVVGIPDQMEDGPLSYTLSGSDLARLGYTPTDSTTLVIGFRLVAPTPGAAAYIGSIRAGNAGIFYQTWATVATTDTALRHPVVQRSPAQNFTVRPAPTPVAFDQLLVGGNPAARALIRFELPAYLRDSATIVRATLELTPAVPLIGLTNDSTRIDANPVLSDFGAKSVIFSNETSTSWIHPGDSLVSLEVTRLVRLWQGTTPLPATVRVRHAFEWSSFLTPRLRSTRSATTGAPRIRITYRPPFAVEGF